MKDSVESFKKSMRLYLDEAPKVKLKRKKTRSNGEGSIRKKGNGWEGRYTFGYTSDGKQIRKSVYAESRKECNEKLQAAIKIAEESQTIPVPEKTPILTEWLKLWLSEYRKELDGASRQRYIRFISKLESLPVSGKKLNDILPIELQQYINEFNSFDLAKRAIGMLKMSMQSAVDNGYIARNPAAALRNPLSKPAEKFEDSQKAFTKKEQEEFLAAIQDNPYRLIYYIILYAGLRRGEATALTWDKIDLVKRQIHVTEAAKRGEGKGYTVGKTKTVKSVRIVPISPTLLAILSAEPNKDGYVCARKNGEMLNADIVTMDFSEVMKKLGQDHTLYHLRHTFATRCNELGISPKVVQSWMGHADISMTLNTYTHATQDLLAEEIGKMV